ncbi:MAG: sulfite exporter TauE/SafE family protein [Microgenomates group bacterium]
MSIFSKIISGYLAGLSVGIYCLGLCLPVFLPILLSEKRGIKKSFWLVVEFSLGRLLGYLFFGLVFGWLGQQLKSNLIHSFASLANLWLGVLMILYSLGTIDKKFCPIGQFNKLKWPILVGFLTGVNICPPFLASLTYVFNLKDTALSLIYFFAFFLGTSTYIIPAAVVGIFTKFPWIQILARISGFLVGFYFAAQSLLKII